MKDKTENRKSHITEVQRDVKNAVMKLHLELEIEYDEELEVIRKYGKAKKSISRDILVPGRMTLHALHYAIQRCFGWQNSHLHCFTLPQEIFSDIAGDKFIDWALLCGQYFRLPHGDADTQADLYWDDDYDGRTSVKTWLKKKYKGPYSYGGFYEMFGVAHSNIICFMKDSPEVELKPTFDEYLNGKTDNETVKLTEADIQRMGMYFNHNMEELLERLKLSEIMTKDGYNLEKVKKTALERAHDFVAYFKGWRDAEDQNKWSEENTPDVIPLTDRLVYSYDYGDCWTVNISCEEIYSFSGTEKVSDDGELINVKMTGSDGSEINDDELVKLAAEVFAKNSPVCIAADGLPVMDDIGGTDGYCNFLANVYDPEMYEEDGGEEREELLEWAKEMGWNGRRTSPEKLL